MQLTRPSWTQTNSKVKTKVMMVISFGSDGIIHKGFVPTSQNVNEEYYVEELSRLIQRISQVMLQFQGMEFGSY
jgi:hypothetical protein